MSEPEKPIKVIISKDQDPPEESELEKIKKERDELKAKITALAMAKHQERVKQLKELQTNVPDTLIDTMNPAQLDLMLEKYSTKVKTPPNPEAKNSGGVGSALLDTPLVSTSNPSTTNLKSVEEWTSFYKNKKYEDNVSLLNNIYKVLMSPSLYTIERYKACDNLAKELLSKWNKKELPVLNFTETNEDRPISSYGKPHT